MSPGMSKRGLIDPRYVHVPPPSSRPSGSAVTKLGEGRQGRSSQLLGPGAETQGSAVDTGYGVNVLAFFPLVWARGYGAFSIQSTPSVATAILSGYSPSFGSYTACISCFLRHRHSDCCGACFGLLSAFSESASSSSFDHVKI